jgi:hypothetical protein
MPAGAVHYEAYVLQPATGIRVSQVLKHGASMWAATEAVATLHGDHERV